MNKLKTERWNFWFIVIFLCLFILIGTSLFNDGMNNIARFEHRITIKYLEKLKGNHKYNVAIQKEKRTKREQDTK